MFYFLYKTTNKLNGKFYIGVHKTLNLNDSYLGSGIGISRAITKYGRENFIREIIEWFHDEDSMYAREIEIVNESFLSESDTYNLAVGGKGGWHHINKLKPSDRLNYGNCQFRKARAISGSSKHLELLKSEEYRSILSAKISVGLHRHYKKNGPIFGRKQSQNSIEKQKASQKLNTHQQGQKNSQFGTCWITNGEINKKIKLSDLNFWISDGWKRGRKV